MDFFLLLFVAASSSPKSSFIRIFHFFYIFSQVTFLYQTKQVEKNLPTEIGLRDMKGNSLSRGGFYVISDFPFVAKIYFGPLQKQSHIATLLTLLFLCKYPTSSFSSRDVLISIIHPIPSWHFFRVTSVNWENSRFIACNIFNFARANTPTHKTAAAAARTENFFFAPSVFLRKHKNPRENSPLNNGTIFYAVFFYISPMLALASRSEKEGKKGEARWKKNCSGRCSEAIGTEVMASVEGRSMRWWCKDVEEVKNQSSSNCNGTEVKRV